MVDHQLRVRGVDLHGVENNGPVIVQMNNEDFPDRFLQDLLTQSTVPVTEPAISSAVKVNTLSQPLYQPVQRMINAAVIDVSCQSVMFPRLDPSSILNAGMVVRRTVRRSGNAEEGMSGRFARARRKTYDDSSAMEAWVKNPRGQWTWAQLTSETEGLDPDPTKRKQLRSGQIDTDARLAALALSAANTESSTPAFLAPPATCVALKRTIVYGMVPTASSEVSDVAPQSPTEIASSDILTSLPAMLRSAQSPKQPPDAPIAGQKIDYRWLSDDFLRAAYPVAVDKSAAPTSDSDTDAGKVRQFTLALRMLHNAFGAFDGTSQGNAILAILNRHSVSYADATVNQPQRMGDFYQMSKSVLLDYQAYANTGNNVPTLIMPSSWDWLNDNDQTDLLQAFVLALIPRTQGIVAPQGRFQDNTRTYRLRMFVRVKGATPSCPPEIIWSEYSAPFRIAAWYETGDRAHPPVPLPDPTSDFVKNAKPNCSFQVPGSLMNAMQGSSLSGLMSGSGGGGGVGLGWICGFNIPLITICAFFVLNIFLSLLNIVFFWLPFIKICIPFPMPEQAKPNQGAS